jgi:hypothetical protein
LVAYALAVNGTLITPVGYESSALPIQDTEDVTTFVYDLSSYVGQTIEVKMGSQSLAESGKDDTLVITEISLSKLAEAE